MHHQQLQPYYKQLADWSRISTSPFSIGAILWMSALSLQPVCKTAQRARIASASGKCKVCKEGGELLACCFCTAHYHNCEECLPQATLSRALAASACFLWGRAQLASRRESLLSSGPRCSSRLASWRLWRKEASEEEEAEVVSGSSSNKGD